MVTEFNGTPMLVNGMMASDASSTAAVQRMWFMALGDDGKSGSTRGVTGIIPGARVGNMFVRRYADGTINSREPELQPRRDVFVSFPAGIAVGSQGELSLIQSFADGGSSRSRQQQLPVKVSPSPWPASARPCLAGGCVPAWRARFALLSSGPEDRGSTLFCSSRAMRGVLLTSVVGTAQRPGGGASA